MLTSDQVTVYLETLHNPRYINSDRTGAILLDGVFHGSILQFYASPNDAMDYGRMVYAKVIEGVYGPIKEYEEIK